MATLSTNEDRSGEGITELSGDGKEWDDRNDDRNVFDMFEDSNDQKTQSHLYLKVSLFCLIKEDFPTFLN